LSETKTGIILDEIRDGGLLVDLAGKLLIAMPAMGDERFARSVILICAHTDEGAMGLIINKPVPDFSFSDLLGQLKITGRGQGRDIRVHFGGPVERGRGFVVHSNDYTCGNATTHLQGGFGMTATMDVLEALAKGGGPRHALLALGYAGWGHGQLENEIARNDWLLSDPHQDLVFSHQDSRKWVWAMRGMGIDLISLSPRAGRA
jgi:putative transcriptional regulator